MAVPATLVTFLRTMTGRTFLLLCIMTAMALGYLWMKGGAAGQLTGRLILCWQVLLCAAIGGDFWRVNLLPSVFILGLLPWYRQPPFMSCHHTKL
jgi:hypothetical protein